MTPKEKAEELIDKFMIHSSGNSNDNTAKQCVLVAANEIIRILNDLNTIYYVSPAIEYWEEVKQELNNL